MSSGEAHLLMLDDELQLARLCSSKLAKLIQGTLSIGVTALTTGVPHPEQFLPERFRILDAHVVVLCSISGKPGSMSLIEQLRACTSGLREGLCRLGSEFPNLDLARAEGLVERLAIVQARVSTVCRDLTRFQDLLEHTGPEVARIEMTFNQISEALLAPSRLSLSGKN